MVVNSNGKEISLPSTDPLARNTEIKRASEERQVRDTLIMQKVNYAHREAFKTRFPGQIEHVMRLTAERLQGILTKKPSDLQDPETWSCTAHEIASLSQALYHLSVINKQFPVLEPESE